MKEKQTHLIINADDLGAHPSIDRGILELASRGIVTSSSLLLTTPNWRETLEQASQISSLGIGLHLDITLGRCLSDPSDIPKLVSEDGSFMLSPRQVIWEAEVGFERKAFLEQVRHEFDTQISVALSSGLQLTHFDSHQHVHMIPSLYGIARKIARKNGITRCRFVREHASTYLNSKYFKLFILKNGYLRWIYMFLNRMRITKRLSSPQKFFGFLMAGNLNRTLIIDYLSEVPPGTIAEFAVHPGYPVKTGNLNYIKSSISADWFRSPGRKSEYDSLASLNFKHEIERRSIQLSSYTCI